jgi:O-antigen/teichoic acid export membrane protein
VLRRIAASGGNHWPASAYLFHAFAGSALSFVVLLLLAGFMSTDMMMVYLPLFFLSQAFIFIGNPIKQLLNARQHFTPFAIISVISNLIKLSAAVFFITNDQTTLNAVVYTLIGCGVFELAALLVYMFTKEEFSFYFKKTAYIKLLKEATPQFFAVMFDAILARADVFIMGIICVASVAAEYGFAFRIYEIAKMPLTIISPILLARFAPMFNNVDKISDEKKNILQQLVNIEAFLAMFIPLVLCIIWSPFLDAFYDKKFGSTNFLQFSILSISIPIHFYINMLWTIGFASKKFKEISHIIAFTAIFHVIVNRIMIPLYGGNGAAITYLCTSTLQLIGYHWLIRKHFIRFSSVSFFVLLFTGIVAYFVALKATDNIIGQLVIGVGLYVVVAVVTKQVKKQHLVIVKDFLKK